MNTHRGRPSTLEEILADLTAAGRPGTIGDALLVMVDEMNACLGTSIKASKRDPGPQTDAERRADIEEMLVLMRKVKRYALDNGPHIQGAFGRLQRDSDPSRPNGGRGP